MEVIVPEPINTMTADLDELGKSIDDLEARYANCSTAEDLAHIGAELEKLGERLDVTRSERLAHLDLEFGAKVAEIRPMLEQLADTTAEGGNPTHAEELRKAADKLAEIARRRQVRDL
jgi:hypothetical protein